MAQVIVKPWVKWFGIFAAVAAIVFGISKYTGIDIGGSSDKDVITVGTNTYAGFMPFMYLNGGLEPSEDSYIYKNYGIKLKIVIQDDFQAGRSAFKNDNIDVLYCTADALPVEMSEGSDMADARLFNISNWSRGADAIVVKKNIETVQDLRGKVIACSEGTASHTLLLNTLETSGLTQDDVKIMTVGSGLDAAQVFKAGQCDAAVVFSPDDQDIVASGSGKVLISTKQASSIICDCLIAKASYLDANRENVQKLVAALMEANELMNTDENAVKEAAAVFAKSYGTDEQFAVDGSKNIHYITLGDAENFFGLNSSYTGVRGEELYSKMCRTYEGLGLCKKPLAWRKVSDASFVEFLSDNPDNVKGNQFAEAGPSFSEMSADEKQTAEVISDKRVVIEFGTASSVLDNDAKTVIDREIVTLAKQFAGARMKIVGNTDNTGDYNYNVSLSQARANAVAEYLIKEYGFDRNRFIIIGNGPKKAVEAGVNGAAQEYRTTDFQLVSE